MEMRAQSGRVSAGDEGKMRATSRCVLRYTICEFCWYPMSAPCRCASFLGHLALQRQSNTRSRPY